MTDFANKDPTLPRRGRKPREEEEYISTSLQKIEMWEKRLHEEKGTLTGKERDELRNKASALRSRVNRKIESKSTNKKMDEFAANFADYINIIFEETQDAETRERILARLGQTKKGKNAATRSEFAKMSKKFVGL